MNSGALNAAIIIGNCATISCGMPSAQTLLLISPVSGHTYEELSKITCDDKACKLPCSSRLRYSGHRASPHKTRCPLFAVWVSQEHKSWLSRPRDTDTPN